jgi:hypothetical protein
LDQQQSALLSFGFLTPFPLPHFSSWGHAGLDFGQSASIFFPAGAGKAKVKD